MSDIVERLREDASPLSYEAADEIERLRKAVKEAHDLLEEYEDYDAFDVLAQALKDTPHD